MGPGDASARDKYYHRICLLSAQRTSTNENHSDVSFICSLCDEQLHYVIQNTLTDDVPLNMAQVNEAYLLILNRYNVDVNGTKKYRTYLKKVIAEGLPNVQFVSSLRRNEPDKLVLSTAVSKAVYIRMSMDNDKIIRNTVNAVSLIRKQIISGRNWSFTGTFDYFENHSLLQSFLSKLLFGSHVCKVSQTRDVEVDRTVDVACPFLVHNTRTDRQVKHQPKSDKTFRQNVQTPMSIGLPLAIHSMSTSEANTSKFLN